MSTTEELRENRAIAEQAARWVSDLHEAGQEQQAQFLNWLKRSPLHVREFLFAASIWRETAHFLEHEPLDLERLIAESAAQPDNNVVRLGQKPSANEQPPAATRAKNSRTTRRWLMAASIVLCAVALGWWLGADMQPGQTYSTTVGEQRAIRLQDGSILHLNTDSRVVVDYTAHARNLRLVKGEVLFTVEPDPARPFTVEAGATIVRALGTQFNVYLRPGDTRISVLDGIVSVNERITVPAGEEAAVTADGTVVKDKIPDIANAAAWRQRRLVFQGKPLAEVAEEFNRYNPRKIRIEGQEARERLLSGTFNADDPDSLIQFLEELKEFTIEADHKTIVVSSTTP